MPNPGQPSERSVTESRPTSTSAPRACAQGERDGPRVLADPCGRVLKVLRISVTDRCNLRCSYCVTRPSPALSQLLSFEEIAEVAMAAVELGIDRLKLTGGEPLLRHGLERLVGLLASIDGVADLSMTTNGILLARHAQALADAGLRRCNVSLDSVDPERFKALTQGGDLRRVLEGIEAAQAAGLNPVKLNCVVQKSSDEPDARAVAAFGRQRGFEVRFIRQMDLTAGEFYEVEGGQGGRCEECSRLRLTAEGLVRPCLFSDIAYSTRELSPREALLQAAAHKPERGTVCTTRPMYTIGG